MAKIALIILPLFGIVLNVYSADGIKTDANYQLFSGGAKVLGMGLAGTSLANDVSGLFFNPAGISLTNQHNLGTSSAELGVDRKFYNLNYILPVGWEKNKAEEKEDFFPSKRKKRKNLFVPLDKFYSAGFGLGFINFNVSNIEARDDWGNRTGDFKDNENTYLLSYGQSVYKDLDLGLAVKYHSQKLETASASGVSFDLGAIFRPLDWKTSFGLAFQNIGGRLAWKVEDPILKETSKYNEPLALKINFGGAYQAKRFTIAADISYIEKRDLRYYLGAEYLLEKTVALRAGLANFKPAFGLGFNFHNMNLDYAFVYDLSKLANQHYSSLGMKFGQRFIKKSKNTKNKKSTKKSKKKKRTANEYDL
ncbi:MAG: hypothetical protein ABII74_01980 [Elusimicrobiota bacterium]